MIASEPLHHFVDDYLSFLYETNPSAATFDGVHLHDGMLRFAAHAASATVYPFAVLTP